MKRNRRKSRFKKRADKKASYSCFPFESSSLLHPPTILLFELCSLSSRQFGPKGALFDGWETRRHNPTYDWVILRLGPKAGGFVSGFDIDTANFNGNEAPEIQVFGLSLSAEEEKLGKNLEESDERVSRDKSLDRDGALGRGTAEKSYPELQYLIRWKTDSRKPSNRS